jgi:hypothetical protein
MDAKTFGAAHNYIIDNFDALPSESVVDVAQNTGETNQPVKSESEDTPLEVANG